MMLNLRGLKVSKYIQYHQLETDPGLEQGKRT